LRSDLARSARGTEVLGLLGPQIAILENILEPLDVYN
jgi:hypothetical protein